MLSVSKCGEKCLILPSSQTYVSLTFCGGHENFTQVLSESLFFSVYTDFLKVNNYMYCAALQIYITARVPNRLNSSTWPLVWCTNLKTWEILVQLIFLWDERVSASVCKLHFELTSSMSSAFLLVPHVNNRKSLHFYFIDYFRAKSVRKEPRVKHI